MQGLGNASPAEQWLPIAGWPGYEVSDLGRVRSWKRRAKGRVWIEDRAHPPSHLKACVRNGYPSVLMCDKDAGRKWESIHRLVLAAFVGDPLPGQQGAHGNGDRRDNRIANLRWATPSENNRDKLRHGTAQYGARIASAKLNFELAEEARAAFEAGERRRHIAQRFGVSLTSIDNVLAKRTYTRADA